MTEKEHHKALLLQWLVLIGHDWADYKKARGARLQFEVGRLERMGYLEHRSVEDNLRSAYEYRLTPKALQLLEEKV